MIKTKAARELRLPNDTGRKIKAETLFARAGLSRNSWMDAYRKNLLYIGNRPAGRNTVIHPDKSLTVRIPDEPSDYRAEKKPFTVLYEDPHLLVLDKEEGLPMLPPQNETAGALVNRVQAYFDLTGVRRKIRFVNRLDRGTSGIVLVAKHKYMQARLQEQMGTNGMDKEYLGIVDKTPVAGFPHSITTPLTKEREGYRYIANPTGKNTHTEIQCLFQDKSSLLRIFLHTGRTHQIRAHMASIACPLRGDVLYGGEAAARMYLHAVAYTFVNWNNRKVKVFCPPKGWASALGLTEARFDALIRGERPHCKS